MGENSIPGTDRQKPITSNITVYKALFPDKKQRVVYLSKHLPRNHRKRPKSRRKLRSEKRVSQIPLHLRLLIYFPVLTENQCRINYSFYLTTSDSPDVSVLVDMAQGKQC